VKLSEQILRVLSAADGRTLSKWLRRGLGGRRIALCFHRVADRRRPRELIPKASMPAGEIDRLIELLLQACKLTVSFDDGYRDSAEYVLSRAPRFADVEWLYFVCPEKTERRAGFRWDLAETRPELSAESVMFGPVDLAGENSRAELLRLAAEPAFELASLDTCRQIQRLPNAALGNHTNLHHRPTLLTAEQFAAECAASTRDFERLFGPSRHFAFPFGVPGVDFSGDHVAALRRLGDFLLWSTEPRPFHARERRAGAVLPRFAVDGTRSWKETAVHIALHCLRTMLSSEARP